MRTPTQGPPGGPRAALAAFAMPLVLTVVAGVAVPMALAAGSPSPTAPTADPTVTAAVPESTPATEPTGGATQSAEPSPNATASATEPATAASASASATPSPTDTPAPSVAQGLRGAGLVLATVPADGGAATYLAPGEPLSGVLPFDDFRLDTLVANVATEDASWTPRLEYRPAGSGDFAVVPTQAVPGVPFHTAPEWVASGAGTKTAPATVPLPAAEAHLASPAGLVAADGRRASGPNPDRARDSVAGTATEQEFSVGVSIDATFGASYELRITDAGALIPELGVAVVTIGSAPAVVTPDHPLTGRKAGGAAVKPVTRTVQYRLVMGTQTLSGVAAAPLSVALPTAGTLGPNGPATIHQPFTSTTSAQCSTCHSTHRGQSQALLTASSQTAECYTCHSAGGLGGALDTQSQFGAVPANDAATRSYYSHDLTAAGHTLASDDQFAGSENRHSQCSDCHNPHSLTSDPDTYTPSTATWTVSGSYGPVPGVSVTNGAAGSAPTYAVLNGSVNPVTSEYQLCFKCHSGYTTQLANDPAHPSRDRTDLGVAFNPANLSYHPIEAAGKNQTQKMADSLAGSSSYKIWNLTPGDTVRCVMCHTSGTASNTTPATANLSVHASANRGILIRPYENRVLSSRNAFYDSAGFALCLTCHAETPYANPSGPGAATATNFEYHGLHVAGISTRGRGGTDIDTAGAGQGNARCAECHFRTHSATQLVPGQTVSGTGLVSFAPDVQPLQIAVPKVGPKYVKTATGGTCTLTCHGFNHTDTVYQVP